ncbi:hypothetical protein J6P59_01960 [bacterium]|nr:hypothetical protein [bacterium]
MFVLVILIDDVELLKPSIKNIFDVSLPAEFGPSPVHDNNIPLYAN